jgi:hypothetical protein
MDDQARTQYRALDSDKIVTTLDKLAARIGERFPNAGLHQVAEELIEVAYRNKAHSRALARPIWWVRVIEGLLVGVVILTLLAALIRADLPDRSLDFIQTIVLLESGINDIVLIGAALFFLFTLETRIKRQRATSDLHQLRSIAHVIDMHQLTKDPDRVLDTRTPTLSSPVRTLNAYELGRYLDYCSELLSLVGKLAALYVQHYNDPVVQQSVDEIESLTTGLSHKIWQKVMILYESMPAEVGLVTGTPAVPSPTSDLPDTQANGQADHA